MIRRNRAFKIDQSIILKFFLSFLFLYLFFVLFKEFRQSHFFTKRDRVNIVFYGTRPSVISIGYADRVNYIGFFDQGSEIYVPGGYGRYKIGALGRLVEIEKKPAVLQRAFSSMLSTYIDFYYYPKKSAIYSFDPPENDLNFFIPRLSLFDVFFTRNYDTNAGFFDRLSLYITMFDKKRSDFSKLKIKSVTDEEGERVFTENRFDKKYQGYFYEKTLREEGKSVQILYSNYKSATILTRIIEGEGIRVADLSENEKPVTTCIIKERDDKPSYSALFLQSILGCSIKKDKTEDADIVLVLSTSLEKNWE